MSELAKAGIAKLNLDNYPFWEQSMGHFFRLKGLHVIIDPPPVVEGVAQPTAEKKDASDGVHRPGRRPGGVWPHPWHHRSQGGLGQAEEHLRGQGNGLVLKLKRELAAFTKRDTESIAAYASRLLDLKAHITSAGHTLSDVDVVRGAPRRPSK